MINHIIRFFRISAVAFLCAISLTACNMFQRDLEWTEDVILNDGRIIRLKRLQEFKGPHSLEHSPSASAYWIEFEHPDTGEKIRWANEMDLAVVALFIKDGYFWVLTTPKYSSSWNIYQRPTPPYFIYKYNTTWTSLPLSEIPIKKIKVNVTVDPGMRMNEIIDSNGHLTSEQTFNTRFKKRQPCIINFEDAKPQEFNSREMTERDYLAESIKMTTE